MSLAAALLAELDDQALDALAELLAPRLADRLAKRDDAPAWMDTRGAAAYLACTESRIYALSSAGRIPCERDGTRLLFQRSALDGWVRSGGGRRP